MAVAAQAVTLKINDADPPQLWTFSNGPEFPGARGQISILKKSGQNIAELAYDFSPTSPAPKNFDPRYVLATRQLPSGVVKNVTEVRIAARPADAGARVRLRIRDSSGQWFQATLEPLPQLASRGVDDLWTYRAGIGDFTTYWSGPADGKIRYPLTSVGVLVDHVRHRGSGSLRFGEISFLEAAPKEDIALDQLTFSTAGAPAGTLADRVGINVQHTKDDVAGSFIRDAGVKILRTDLFWERTETTRGKHDFSDFDRLVRYAEQHGMRVVAILDYGNPLHTSGRRVPPTTQREIEAFSAFASAAVKHYAGRPVTFEIWNEPDRPAFWDGTPDAEEYATLLGHAAGAMRTARPSATLLSAGLSTPNVDTYNFWGTLKAEAALSNLSGLGTHLYGSGAPEARWGDILQLQQFARSIRSDMKVWCTEFGYSSATLSTRKNGHEEAARVLQAAYTVRMLLLNWWADLPLSVVYHIRDSGTEANNREHNFGFVTIDNTPKPALAALTTLMTHAQGRKLSAAATNLPDGVYAVQLEDARTRVIALWRDATSGPMTLSYSARPARVTNMTGEILAPRTSGGFKALPIPSENPIFIEIEK